MWSQECRFPELYCSVGLKKGIQRCLDPKEIDAYLPLQSGNTWAAESIWYIRQLAGCSYLVLQSRMVFEGLTSYSTPISCLSAVFPFDWLAGGWLLMAGRRAGWLGLAANLSGWLLAGWLAGGLAGWAWLACWLAWLAGCWLAGCIWMAGIWWMWAPGFTGMNLTSFWPRFDLVLGLVQSAFANWLYQGKTMKIKCLPRIRGVPTYVIATCTSNASSNYSAAHERKVSNMNHQGRLQKRTSRALVWSFQGFQLCWSFHQKRMRDTDTPVFFLNTPAKTGKLARVFTAK